MENRDQLPHPFEPTADELPPRPRYHFTMDRRKFLQLSGGGLLVAFALQDVFPHEHKTITGELPEPAEGVAAWLHIGEDGKVTVYTGKVEVGQNIRTSLSQLVAEELMVPISSITMIMGDTDLVPYDRGTFGSLTTPQMGPQLRRAAATAREALLEMAAKNWDKPVTRLMAENGMIVDKAANKKISYGELTKGQQLLMPVADKVQLIAAKDWKVAGKSVPRINDRSFITGRHQYVSDMKMPEMLHAKILRAPSYKARLKRCYPSMRNGKRKAANLPTRIYSNGWWTMPPHPMAGAMPAIQKEISKRGSRGLILNYRPLTTSITSRMCRLNQERRLLNGWMASSRYGPVHNVPLACSRNYPMFLRYRKKKCG
jgi:hypothetical protein